MVGITPHKVGRYAECANYHSPMHFLAAGSVRTCTPPVEAAPVEDCPFISSAAKLSRFGTFRAGRFFYFLSFFVDVHQFMSNHVKPSYFHTKATEALNVLSNFYVGNSRFSDEKNPETTTCRTCHVCPRPLAVGHQALCRKVGR